MKGTSVIPFDPSKLAQSLRRVSREAAPVAAFLKMDKTGEWTYGANAEEVSDKDEFYVNPEGFQHGFVSWAKEGGEKLGEIVAPITEAIPDTGPVPGGSNGWEAQLGLHLRPVKDSVNLVYRSSSVGGKRAVAQLAELVATKLSEGDKKFVPVVTLDSDSYKHKSYGKIFNPVFTIVRWSEMPKDAAPEPAAKTPALKAPAKKPAKKTK